MERPGIIKAAIGWQLAEATLVFLGALAVIFSNQVTGTNCTSNGCASGVIVGTFSFLVVAAFGVAAYGLWKGEVWGRWLTWILAIIGELLAIGTFNLSGFTLETVIVVPPAILVSLSQVEQWFDEKR